MGGAEAEAPQFLRLPPGGCMILIRIQIREL